MIPATILQYACRKTLADRRVRVRGRFAKNNEIFEEETEVKKNDDNIPHHHHEKDTYCTSDAVQVLSGLQYLYFFFLFYGTSARLELKSYLNLSSFLLYSNKKTTFL
jgi:hypothetical protein